MAKISKFTYYFAIKKYHSLCDGSMLTNYKWGIFCSNQEPVKMSLHVVEYTLDRRLGLVISSKEKF